MLITLGRKLRGKLFHSAASVVTNGTSTVSVISQARDHLGNPRSSA